jgi:ABC-type dipeptide/oligopeptide/nickel transport system ATPase component
VLTIAGATEAMITSGAEQRAGHDAGSEPLEAVGISDPARRLHDYPHQFSGGMRQRVTLRWRWLVPSILTLTSRLRLDVTIQQIVEL